MSDPKWKILDVPLVPDPSATQPPTQVPDELLDLLDATAPPPTESLHPQPIPPAAEAPPSTDYTPWLFFGLGLFGMFVVLLSLFMLGVALVLWAL